MLNMTDEEIADWKRQIDCMSREDMCRLWRYARVGHPCFNISADLHEYFRAKFDRLGGFSPELSKKIGWPTK